MSDDRRGNWVREARDSMGLSQAEFAARVGVSFGAVQKWEQGKGQPRPRTKLRILELAGPEFQRRMGLSPGRVKREAAEDLADRIAKLEDRVEEILGRLARMEAKKKAG